MTAIELRGARILITGGAGLIGSTIADQLVPFSPAEIVVFDDFSRGRPGNLGWVAKHGPLKVVEGDVRDRAAVSAAMAGVDLVFHQAAIRITRCAEAPREALEVLADGTFNVLEAAVAAGVRKVVAASSASVYGQASRLPTDEEHHPWNNQTIYGAAKAFNEGLLRSFKQMSDLDYVALRYFNVYGPRMDIHGAYTEVLIRWIERIERGEGPLIFGDGSHTVDLVHVDDVARANLLAAMAPVTDETCNVATGTATSLAELARLLLTILDRDLPIEYGPERVTNGVRARLGDTRKAHELLGFDARIGLATGLAGLVSWWRAQRSHAVLPSGNGHGEPADAVPDDAAPGTLEAAGSLEAAAEVRP